MVRRGLPSLSFLLSQPKKYKTHDRGTKYQCETHLPFLTETMGTMPMIQVTRPRMSIETILEARSICSMMTENVLTIFTNLSSLPVHLELPGLCSQFLTQRMFTGDIIQTFRECSFGI